MIDSDYHYKRMMTLTMIKARPARTAPEPDSVSDTGANSAIASLLNHLAEELALEYVRLMEEAARHHDPSDCEPQREEG